MTLQSRDEADRLAAAVERHNAQCYDLCGLGDQEALRCGYSQYFRASGRRCPDCPVYDVCAEEEVAAYRAATRAPLVEFDGSPIPETRLPVQPDER